MKPYNAFGMHLTVDAYDGDRETLADKSGIRKFLVNLVQKIGMTQILPPLVVYYGSPKAPEDAGISGFVLIAESHISIHTFPIKQFASLDVFSCKEFDHNMALSSFRRQFGFLRYDIKVSDRGLEFPKNISESTIKNYVNMERVKCPSN